MRPYQPQARSPLQAPPLPAMPQMAQAPSRPQPPARPPGLNTGRPQTPMQGQQAQAQALRGPSRPPPQRRPPGSSMMVNDYGGDPNAPTGPLPVAKAAGKTRPEYVTPLPGFAGLQQRDENRRNGYTRPNPLIYGGGGDYQ